MTENPCLLRRFARVSVAGVARGGDEHKGPVHAAHDERAVLDPAWHKDGGALCDKMPFTANPELDLAAQVELVVGFVPRKIRYSLWGWLWPFWGDPGLVVRTTMLVSR